MMTMMTIAGDTGKRIFQRNPKLKKNAALSFERFREARTKSQFLTFPFAF